MGSRFFIEETSSLRDWSSPEGWMLLRLGQNVGRDFGVIGEKSRLAYILRPEDYENLDLVTFGFPSDLKYCYQRAIFEQGALKGANAYSMGEGIEVTFGISVRASEHVKDDRSSLFVPVQYVKLRDEIYEKHKDLAQV